METKDLTRTAVYIQHGGADTDEFWDVSLNDEQLAYAEVKGEDRRGFSIVVDLETGDVALNPGYEKGSAPDRDEQSMFREFEAAVVEALYDEIENLDILPAFKAAAAEDRDLRHAQLEELAEALAAEDEDEDEDEDCEMGLHSWIDKVGKLPASTRCTRCGELYGNPD